MPPRGSTSLLTSSTMTDTEQFLRDALDTLHERLSDSKSLEEETGLVNDIVLCHEELAKQLFKGKNKSDVDEYVQQIREDLGDFCLDWAIASKRAQKKRQSVNAQMLRMQLCPDYLSVDAIRLLGYEEDEQAQDWARGVFETRFNDDKSMAPTEKAQEIGYRLRRLLLEHAYTNDNCNTYLKPFIASTDRLFDAATFTAQRWNLPQDSDSLFALDILVKLFLFGVAVERETVALALGGESLDLLVNQAAILMTHPVSPSLLVSEVQIYPISFSDLHVPRDNKDCFFLTDWSIESMRSSKEAVMSIGYDSLELMSLAGGGDSSGGRLLDVCCGSGIQGIWEILAAKDDAYVELVLSDLNPRACKFACANLTLNSISIPAKVYQGDLYQSLGNQQTFTKILSNPPFVALPKDLSDVSAYFAGAGAGDDGTHILKRIVQDAPLAPNGTMLLVTELPNIEDSCNLMTSFCGDENQQSVRIAYVGKDVETVEQYGQVRQAEATSFGGEEKKDEWAEQQRRAGIQNRALALVALQQGATETSLYKFGGSKKTRKKRKKKKRKSTTEEEVIEEDEFLTAEGISYTRKHLLT